MSKHLFLFVSVAFLAAAAIIYGGVRPGKIRQFVRLESKADYQAMRDDVRIFREECGVMHSALLTLWLDARADTLSLRADAHFRARQLAKPFVAGGEFAITAKDQTNVPANQN